MGVVILIFRIISSCFSSCSILWIKIYYCYK